MMVASLHRASKPLAYALLSIRGQLMFLLIIYLVAGSTLEPCIFKPQATLNKKRGGAYYLSSVVCLANCLELYRFVSYDSRSEPTTNPADALIHKL